MNRTEVTALVMSLCPHLGRSRAKTLSRIVPAAMETERVSPAEMGRRLSKHTGLWAKHCIKRVDRLIGNIRIEPAEAMRGVVRWLAQPRQRLVVSMDWVEIRSFPCLVLAARLRGRALPLLWTVYRDAQLYRSQNNLEYGLLTVRPGARRMLRNVLYRKVQPVRQHVAVVWERGEPEPPQGPPGGLVLGHESPANRSRPGHPNLRSPDEHRRALPGHKEQAERFCIAIDADPFGRAITPRNHRRKPGTGQPAGHLAKPLPPR